MATVRECYRRIAKFQQAPYIPNYEGGLSPRTIDAWRKEGMPADVSYEQFFGIDRYEIIDDISYAPIPGVRAHYENPDFYRAMLTPLGYNVGYDKANSLVARKGGRDYYIGHSSWGNVRLYPVDRTEDGLAEGAFLHVHDALRDRGSGTPSRGTSARTWTFATATTRRPAAGPSAWPSGRRPSIP